MTLFLCGRRQSQSVSLACDERVTFFAGAKKVTKETPFFFTYGVFAECTSMYTRRTAHFLCAIRVVVYFCEEDDLSIALECVVG